MKTSLIDIRNFTYDKLKAYLATQNEKPFRAAQLMKWLYQKRAASFSQMTDLSKEFRQKLEKSCEIYHLRVLATQISLDGTQKFLFELKDGKTVEAVYIPACDRVTLCISTQVGCRMMCTFCFTAKQKFVRNLSASEIVGQVLDVQKRVEKRITNIVMMGMGEPLDNYDAVVDALDILQSHEAFGFSQRKITISTAGLIPKIIQFGKDVAKSSQINLAISLNAPHDEIRNQIMPINKKYNLEDLLEACRTFPLKPTRRITFEYVMLKGINDTIKDAKLLAHRIEGIRCKVNLIPFNEYPQASFQRPTANDVLAFQKVLVDGHITATIRESRGCDIMAACGQLASTPR